MANGDLWEARSPEDGGYNIVIHPNADNKEHSWADTWQSKLLPGNVKAIEEINVVVGRDIKGKTVTYLYCRVKLDNAEQIVGYIEIDKVQNITNPDATIVAERNFDTTEEEEKNATKPAVTIDTSSDQFDDFDEDDEIKEVKWNDLAGLVNEINTSNAQANAVFSNLSMRNFAGIFGLPYQFLPTTDIRLDESATTSANSATNSSNYQVGYEYAEKIIEHIPLLFLTPGKAAFMQEFSKGKKEGVLEKILSNASSNSIADLLGSDEGRYFTFEQDIKDYYNYVNPMCRIAAQYLGIGNQALWSGQGGSSGTLNTMNWMNFTESHISSLGNFGTWTAVPFYLDSETSISESFSNSTTQSMIASATNSISDMGRELSFLLGTGASQMNWDVLSADMGENVQNLTDMVQGLLGEGNMFSRLATHLTTLAVGGRMIFPEIWADSSFSRSYTCEFKFISPDPSKLSIYLNVLVPLFHLLGMVAPQIVNNNPNAYMTPFLVRAVYKGFFNIDTGIITDMSVTKGAECQWTIDGLPTSISVSITIKDLYQAMSMAKADDGLKYSIMTNTSQMDYIANWCGINIFEPEVARLAEMWLMTNVVNRVGDVFRVNLWGGLQDTISNVVQGIWGRLQGRR